MNDLTAIWALMKTSKATANDVNKMERDMLIL